MKRFLTFLFICTLISVSSQADPGIPDTVRIDSVAAMTGESVVLPVYFYNDEPLSAIEMTVHFDDDYLTLDSFSMVGSRLEGIPTADFDSGGIFDLFVIILGSDSIPAGNGLLCNLHFDINPSAPIGLLPVDSITYIRQVGSTPHVLKTIFGGVDSQGILPQFITGQINVLESPPVADSVWVQNVSGQPGDRVNVEIYGYNSGPLDTIYIALEYDSDDITYVNAIFNGTRAETAQSSIAVADTDQRQILININYNDITPLAAGTGVLAIVQFDIKADAALGDVAIDSTRYFGFQSLEFSPLGDPDFTPYFTPGLVTISNSTDIVDEYKSLLPTSFALRQNYPNPFNPSTTIKFELPQASQARLEVFNIIGQKVTTLVDDFLSAGIYEVNFEGISRDGSPLASGVYFYRIMTDEFTESKKMTLLK